MRIIGLDLSITCTGISLPDGRTLALKPRARGDERLPDLRDQVRYWTDGTDAELVVLEDLAGLYRGDAARIIPMLHGVVRVALMDLGVPYMPLNPSTLKRFATGSGTADKTAMAMAAYKRLGREYATSDECDADWLRVAGLVVYSGGPLWGAEAPGNLIHFPQDQVRALGHGLKGKKIDWPGPPAVGREPRV
jgi:Holliday junction resolvasome RuvABC endonuclease subunit